MYTNTAVWGSTIQNTKARQNKKMSNVFIAEYCDESDLYSMDQHKFIHVGHSGKGRSKREARQHTNGYDPNGHTRKLVQKLVNRKMKLTQDR